MRQKSKPNHALREKLGRRIRDLRKAAGFSQEDLGFKANYPPNLYWFRPESQSAGQGKN